MTLHLYDTLTRTKNLDARLLAHEIQHGFDNRTRKSGSFRQVGYCQDTAVEQVFANKIRKKGLIKPGVRHRDRSRCELLQIAQRLIRAIRCGGQFFRD